MLYGWHPPKAVTNAEKRKGVAFERVYDFDWSTALVRADTRMDYGEVRLNALGVIGERLHHLTFTVERRCIWVISLRKANNKEIDRYEAENAS